VGVTNLNVQITRPAFDKYADPTLVLDSKHVYPGIRASEFCNACDGNGRELVMTGSRWADYQGGMWVPDEREVECESCDGTGRLDVTRCPRCGHHHEDTEDQQDGVQWCDCDEDDLNAWLNRLTAITTRAIGLGNAAADAEEYGLIVPANIHGLTWNELHYLWVRFNEADTVTVEPIEYGKNYTAFRCRIGRARIDFFGEVAK
jgi:hypothetical protein